MFGKKLNWRKIVGAGMLAMPPLGIAVYMTIAFGPEVAHAFAIVAFIAVLLGVGAYLWVSGDKRYALGLKNH